MVLNGVGAAKMNPKLIGRFIGRKELKRRAHGIILPVSGWIAVETTVSATRSSRIYSEVSITFLSPVFSNASFSVCFWRSKSFCISVILDEG